MYALTVFSLVLAMMLMDKEAGDDTFHGVLWYVWSVDVPDDVHISIYILYITFGLFTMLILSVYTADLASYLLNQVTNRLLS
jgi:hypothetical protein